MGRRRESKIKTNALVRIINDYLDIVENLDVENKLDRMLKLVNYLVSWY